MVNSRLQTLLQRDSPYAKTAAYYLCFIILGLAMSAVGPLLPSLAEQTGSSLGAVSFILTARSSGYLAGSLITGRLFDRFAGHQIVIGSLLLIAVAFILIPLVRALLLLILLAVLLGLSEAGVDISINAMLVWIHGPAIPPFMNGLHFFFGFGALLAPVVFAQMVSAGWQGTALFWGMAILVLLALIAISRLPSPKITAQTGTIGLATHRNYWVILIAAGFLLYVGIEVGLSGWIYSYALAANLADEITAAYLTSAFWAAFTIGRLLGIPLAHWFSPSRLLAFDVAGMLVGFTVLNFVPGSLALWIGVVLTAVSMASCFPSLMSLAGKMMPISARVTGWFFAGSGVGGMLVPWVIGQFFESGGPQYTLIVLGAFSVLLAALVGGILLAARARPHTA